MTTLKSTRPDPWGDWQSWCGWLFHHQRQTNCTPHTTSIWYINENTVTVLAICFERGWSELLTSTLFNGRLL